MKKTILPALLALLLCLSAAALGEGAGFLGQPFPDFTAEDTLGNTFTLSEALKDHEAVLINLWATWCPPCEAEMPHLEAAYQEYGDRVAFIVLSTENNDTIEKIEAYRQAHGLTFPMGRDENQALMRYVGSSAIPVTVIVDRFGNAAFQQVGSFSRAGDVKRLLEFFLGNQYTETVTLTEIPKDSSTRAFPASGTTEIRVDNESARRLLFGTEQSPGTDVGYVVTDGTARLRIDASAEANLPNLLLYDARLRSFAELPELLDAEREAYLWDVPMPDADTDPHYTVIYLVEGSEGRIIGGIYLIAGDEYIEELVGDMRAQGFPAMWEESRAAPPEDPAPKAYLLHILDQDGAPVPGVTVNFCTDTDCVLLISDESGTVAYDGTPDVYRVKLADVPEGYSFDKGFEMHTGLKYRHWVLRIRKDG